METGMEIESVVGTWILVGSTSINGQIAFLDDEPDPNGVLNWLNGLGEELEASIKHMTGLELEISQDGRFSEALSGQPKVPWFDVEGVLSNDVAPFNGALTSNDKLVYLQPDGIPRWSVHAQNRYGKAILRYDDGDTKICDSLRLKGDRLLRTVNVVTDELYTNRVLVAYEKRS
jgi:hypothetical protein